MSRIEEAIEKAAQKRGHSDAPKTVRLPTRESQSPLPPTPSVAEIANPFLVSANAPNSPVAEEYRKLKSILVKLVSQEEEFKNTLMVTSCLSGEGKSITSLNLAISLAQEYDHTVLLVDGDLRKPSLHKYLGIEAERGLSDCLLHGVDVGDVLIKTGVGKLSLLPAGARPSNPGELFSSQKMRELISEMKHRYPDRFIIIDTPPIIPFSECRSLAPTVDGVLFVVMEGVVTLDTIKEGFDALKGSNMLGIVYNQAANSGLRKDYYYYYSDPAARKTA